MGSYKWMLSASGVLACALLLAQGSSNASERAPFRASIFAPAAPPIVRQYEFASAHGDPAPAPVEHDLFFLADSPPAVALTGQSKRFGAQIFDAHSGDAIDFAEALLSDDQRKLAFALESWVKTPVSGPTAADRRRRRAAIAAAYAARAYQPLWRDNGAENDSLRLTASSVASRLRLAGEDGLDLHDYPVPAVDQGAATIEDEIALSEAIAAYAAQASGGRVDPQRISHLIGARPSLPEPAAVLTRVAAAGAQAGDILADYNPPHYGYQALKTKLAELRSERATDSHASATLVADARSAHDDGAPLLRKATRGAQTKASLERFEWEVIANMERWRWLPRDLGDSRIEVNIPDFELAVVRDGEVTHRARVIVGKEATPTPVFSNAMQFIIVNPYWNVPPSILNKEMLPQNGGDVSALQQRGFLVSYRHGKLSVRQPPGEKNALGRIKFMFPNDFSVYLHDTPSRSLFAASHRAFSHGCMRVDQPFALAEAVLGPGSGWSEQRVRHLIGGSERYINLNKPLPIHIEYFTAYVDEEGQLKLRGDLYGYSARVRNALGLGS
jgi:murein L,D-transpeptidase YcbB/YkuD